MTSAAIPFPNISPELISVTLFGFELAIRWYALAYIAGILLGWWLIRRLLKRPALWPQDQSPMGADQLEAFVTWAILGVIIGGRLGYVLFYDLSHYLANPVDVLRLGQGGMAFHGGFLGVIVVAALFARKHAIPLGSLSDSLALVAPIGIGLGRISNFINAELWGRPSDAPWAVIFPGHAAQDCPGPVGVIVENAMTLCARHPSQLYEAALEGALLFAILLTLALSGSFKKPFLITGLFFAGYGAARMVVELFRQADAQFITPGNPWGHVLQLGPAGLTMGQLLSLPMVLVGISVTLWALRRS